MLCLSMNPDQAPNQPAGQPRQLNLQTMANQMLAGLQHHFDILAFHMAAQDCVTEEAYQLRVNAPGLMPVPQAHRNFEQTQAFAHDLIQRQVINDTLNLCVAALNNSHLFLAAIKAQKEHGQAPESQQAANQSQQTYMQAQLDEKFNRLEQDYGILCELEDTIISLGFALQALMQFQGLVQAAQVDGQGELAFDFKRPKAGGAQGELEDARKVFREGEKIIFAKDELQLMLITTTSFFGQLFQAVARYAEENNPQQA